MIQGKKKELLTKEAVLKRVTPYDIYRNYIGDFKLNIAFRSPLPERADSKPSFLVGTKSGNLYHIDFGDARYAGNCFDLVMQMTGAPNLDEALKRIDKDMSLGIGAGEVGDYQRITSKYQQPKIITRPPSLVQVVTRKFNKEELAYWNQYHQDISDLQRENIYAPTKIYLNRQAIPMSKNELYFAYLLEDKWKIYRPFSPDKSLKWYPNNIPNNAMEGLDDILGVKKGLILKSRKDRLVVKKIFPHTCSVQNESLIAFSLDNIQYLDENIEEKFLGYDSDGPGKAASLLVTSTFGFKHVNVPDIYLKEGIKDFADWGKAYGLQAIEDHFKLKEII